MRPASMPNFIQGGGGKRFLIVDQSVQVTALLLYKLLIDVCHVGFFPLGVIKFYNLLKPLGEFFCTYIFKIYFPIFGTLFMPMDRFPICKSFMPQ